LGIVLHARSCAMGGGDVVGEVKGVEEVGVWRLLVFFYCLFGNRSVTANNNGPQTSDNMATAPSCWLSHARGLEPTVKNASVATAKLQQFDDRFESQIE